MMFHDAYHENAPCAVHACTMAGQVREITELKNQVVAVAKDMPIGRMYKGYASAL